MLSCWETCINKVIGHFIEDLFKQSDSGTLLSNVTKVRLKYIILKYTLIVNNRGI